MEEINPGPPFLLNISDEIIEEIISYLVLPVRKNLRLTCKKLYKLCNSDRFCRDEKIIWSENLIKHVNVQSDLNRIGRCYYNLAMNSKTLETSSILPFFEEYGAKVRSLVINSCKFLPGSLESIITLCEGLCSLCLTFSYGDSNVLSACFMFESLNVTYLKLTLPRNKPDDFLHRMFSIFPNVKQLHIEVNSRIYWGKDAERLVEEYSPCLGVIMKLGGNLEGLELKFPLQKSISEGSKFFEALPNLKDLSVDFDERIRGETADWYPYCSNLVSVELSRLKDFHPPEIKRLLTNTGLKHLRVESKHLSLDEECFKKLVASQLHTIKFSGERDLSGSLMTNLDSPLETNKTVKYLHWGFYGRIYLRTLALRPQPTIILLLEYFRGLVHLTIDTVTDSILQSIFRWQENLRSLVFNQCSTCSINGFCGLKAAGFEYSIKNLQKLELLTMYNIRPEVIQSDAFKRAFSFPRLKYLLIDCLDWFDVPRSKLPMVLYENLTELRALRLRGDAMPLLETFPSSFRNLKHLNYFRINTNDHEEFQGVTNSVTFIKVRSEYFSTVAENYKYEYSSGQAYHDKESDRFVILDADSHKSLHSPKIGAFQINWIRV